MGYKFCFIIFIFVTTKRGLGNQFFLLFSYLSQPREIWGISSFYYFHICHNQERSGESVLFIIFIFVTTKRDLGNQFFLLFSHSSQPREVWGISSFYYFHIRHNQERSGESVTSFTERNTQRTIVTYIICRYDSGKKTKSSI